MYLYVCVYTKCGVYIILQFLLIYVFVSLCIVYAACLYVPTEARRGIWSYGEL